jgi:hypothetical protein
LDQIGAIGAGEGSAGGADMLLAVLRVGGNSGEPNMRTADGIRLLNPFVHCERLFVLLPRSLAIRAPLRKVAQPLDAVGLAQHSAHLPIQR